MKFLYHGSQKLGSFQMPDIFVLQEYSITYFLRLCEEQQNTCISFPSDHCVQICNILTLSVSECSGNSK